MFNAGVTHTAKITIMPIPTARPATTGTVAVSDICVYDNNRRFLVINLCPNRRHSTFGFWVISLIFVGVLQKGSTPPAGL